MMVIAERPCCYKSRGCLFSSDACDNDASSGCTEKVRRIELERKPCLIMQRLGYREDFLGCSVPTFRALLPENVECCSGNFCLVVKPQEAQDIFKNNTRIDVIEHPWPLAVALRAAFGQ